MPTKSVAAGLLMYRINNGTIEFFLVHPGGPFFKNKDKGHWSIPKGIPNEGEDLLAAAQREFTEETGLISKEPYTSLGTATQKSGKTIHAWAFAGDWDESAGIISNTFELEWPPKSRRIQNFP